MKHVKTEGVERIASVSQLPFGAGGVMQMNGTAVVPHAWRAIYAAAGAMAEQRLRQQWLARLQPSLN